MAYPFLPGGKSPFATAFPTECHIPGSRLSSFRKGLCHTFEQRRSSSRKVRTRCRIGEGPLAVFGRIQFDSKHFSFRLVRKFYARADDAIGHPPPKHFAAKCD